MPPDSDENITVENVPLDGLLIDVTSGHIRDANTIASVLLVSQRCYGYGAPRPGLV
jgi:hypothetical protein